MNSLHADWAGKETCATPYTVLSISQHVCRTDELRRRAEADFKDTRLSGPDARLMYGNRAQKKTSTIPMAHSLIQPDEIFGITMFKVAAWWYWTHNVGALWENFPLPSPE